MKEFKLDLKTKHFPKKGNSWESVKKELMKIKDMDTSEQQGRLNIYCHQGNEELKKIRLESYSIFSHTNAFLSGYENGLHKMETEVLQMALEIMNAGPDACAHITTGGTESIFCAMHTVRQWARIKYPKIKNPEIIMPYSAHAAFDKACHFLDMTVVRIPVKEDFRADVQAMQNAITPNTIAMIGSAPCWPYGTIDPIPEIAKVAQKHKLWMHTDACVGGFINPWLEKLGYDIPLFDFRVEGVYSISADLHKHGYASKPCSTVLYKTRDFEIYHYVPIDNWPDGEYKTTGFVGSRPAGSIATAWSVMKYLGEEGYIEITRQCMDVKHKLVKGIENIADFKCLKNDSTMIYFRSETLDMPTVIGGMVEKKYFPFGVFNPILLQLIPEPVSDEVIEKYLSDLRDVAVGVKNGTIKSTAISRYS